MAEYGWVQCRMPLGDFSIQDRFTKIYIERGAPSGAALLFRGPIDHSENIFLLSPAASIYADMIGGAWEPAGDPREYRKDWSFLVTQSGDDLDTLFSDLPDT